MKYLLPLLATGLLWAADNRVDKTGGVDKTGAHCAPPPGSQAPALPAYILAGMGHVEMPIATSSPEAQKFFNQGLAQLHSFWGKEAERSFRQAAALDPAAPMPWFGVALASSEYRPRFQADHRDAIFGKGARTSDRAKAAVEKALSLSGAATEREKLYIAAITALRDGRQADPDEAFVAGLRAVLEKFPQEVEARVILSLWLQRGYVLPERTPRPGTMEAVAMLKQLAAEVPEHPGVQHYIIHGWEGSTFASDAWAACEKYATQAPDIPHALHMPGHIYAQTGKWPEAIKSFSDAAAKEVEYMTADKQYGSGHHGHNVHFLAMAYSYSGDFENAAKAAHRLLEIKETAKQAEMSDNVYSAYRQGHFALLRAMVQHAKWDAILDGQTLPAINQPRPAAWTVWARGVAYAHKGDVKNAKREAKKFEDAVRDFSARTKLAMPEELIVAREELAGHILLASGKKGRGLDTLTAAMEKERHLRYSEPPYYPRPVAEALGAAAVKAGKTDLARRAYRVSLEQYPAAYQGATALRTTAAGGI